MGFLPFTRPTIDEDTIAAVADVLRSGWITSGPRVQALEKTLSERFGGRSVRVANSGTATLEIALRLCGIGSGDEVITTPMSWVATANVILTVDATPVFVDVDLTTRHIDLEKIEAAITPRTRALIPVDLAGLPVNRDKIRKLSDKYHLRVIEDAAQSIGSNWGGKEIGSFGDLVSFSFHANKNITSIEGGCLVMNDEAEARLFEKYRLQGVTRLPDGSIDVDLLGGKSNLTDVAAVVCLLQLQRLEEFTQKRRELARNYFELFDPSLGCLLPVADFEQSNWHMFQPLLPLDQLSISRNEFIAKMKEKGIGVGVHYPAMHLFSLYRSKGFNKGDFPVAEKIGRETITLPLFPTMSKADVARVCEATASILKPAQI